MAHDESGTSGEVLEVCDLPPGEGKRNRDGGDNDSTEANPDHSNLTAAFGARFAGLSVLVRGHLWLRHWWLLKLSSLIVQIAP